jgi:hypothetical protein
MQAIQKRPACISLEPVETPPQRSAPLLPRERFDSSGDRHQGTELGQSGCPDSVCKFRPVEFKPASTRCRCIRAAAAGDTEPHRVDLLQQDRIGVVGLADRSSMTSRISTPRRLIRSGTSRTSTASWGSITSRVEGARAAAERITRRRIGLAGRNGIAADHVERHRILLVSGLCPTDTHALFVDESHSFPTGLRGLLALELISNRSAWSPRGSAVSRSRIASCCPV